ncbi:MAG: Mini-ribonuclease 3 [Clostridia bacterium]|nr:Mini-ribonuclease 3 [Clostridia bacterium]
MIEKEKAGLYPPLVLAYIGDSVYEVFTRKKLLKKNPNLPAHKLHKENVKYVKAKAQSDAMEKIEPILTEQELAIYKRGRNAKSATVPKNADLVDYRRATGFETLIGFLELSGQHERLLGIMEIAFDSKID